MWPHLGSPGRSSANLVYYNMLTRYGRCGFALALALLLGGVGVAGCGGGDAHPTAVSVYFLRGDRVGVVHREVEGERVAGAIAALLGGPSSDERAAGLSTAVPDEVGLLGVELVDGVVTVDLSRGFDDSGSVESLRARLAQLVFTATQFPDTSGLRLRLDGEPVRTFSVPGVVLAGEQTRADYEASAPQILVDRPVPGDTVASGFHLTGSANTFEATFLYELVANDGSLLADTFVTATCGTGCRGTFDVAVTFDGEGEALLRVFERSAADGSVVNLVEIPLQLE